MKKKLLPYLMLLVGISSCKKQNNSNSTQNSTTTYTYLGDTTTSYFTGVRPATLQEILGVSVIDTSAVPVLETVLDPQDNLPVPPPTSTYIQQFKSCSGWAIGYGMLGYQYKVIGDYQYADDKMFSPYYIWNQINNGQNQGAETLIHAMELLKQQGCCKWNYMPGSSLLTPTTQPTLSARTNASNYKINEYHRIEALNIDLIKFFINKRKYALPFACDIDRGFKYIEQNCWELRAGNRWVWKRELLGRPENTGKSGHAMLICGYDDSINAFKVLNSWGPSWGKNEGYCWIDYDLFKKVIFKNPSGPFDNPEIYFAIIKRPTLTTNTASFITQSTAVSGGNITNDGGSTITTRGLCWNTAGNPTLTDDKTIESAATGSFSHTLTRLSSGRAYYVRAYATTAAGTTYGNQISFTTQSTGSGNTVTDIDGNVYTTVQIGTQTWMVENLKTTKYRNGDPILNITDPVQWRNMSTSAYCNYNNDINNFNTYGRLYNYYVVEDLRKIAPLGWHIPSKIELEVLANYLGGINIAGGKMKAITSHWNSPNIGATNSSGFTGLPGGARADDGINTTTSIFIHLGYRGFWWSSTNSQSAGLTVFALMNQNEWFTLVQNLVAERWQGNSIRLIKD